MGLVCLFANNVQAQCNFANVVCPNDQQTLYFENLSVDGCTTDSIRVTVSNGKFPYYQNATTKLLGPTVSSIVVQCTANECVINYLVHYTKEDIPPPASGQLTTSTRAPEQQEECETHTAVVKYYVRHLHPIPGWSIGPSGSTLNIGYGTTSVTLTTGSYQPGSDWCYDQNYDVTNYNWTIPSGFNGATTTLDSYGSTSSTFTDNTGEATGVFKVKAACNVCESDITTADISITITRSLLNPTYSTIPTDNVMCNNQTATLAINPVTAATSYTWRILSGPIRIGSTYSSGVTTLNDTVTSITIATPTTGTGLSTISVQAHRTGEPSTEQVITVIHTGPPTQPTVFGPAEIDCEEQGNFYYEIDPPPVGSTICWTVTGALQSVGDTVDWMVQVIPLYEGSAQAYVEVYNNCGTVSHSKGVWVSCWGPPLLYPNPAAGEFIVDMSAAEPELSMLSEDYTLSLTSITGVPYMSGAKTKQKIKKYKLNKVPDGQYNVIITFKGKTYSQILMVKK